MSLTKLIRNNLRLTWTVLGDLRLKAIFTRSGEMTFDFEKGVPANSTVSSELEVIPLGSKVKGGVTMTELLIKSSHDFDLESFSEVTFKGKKWRVGEVLDEFSGFVILSIHRGGANE